MTGATARRKEKLRCAHTHKRHNTPQAGWCLKPFNALHDPVAAFVLRKRLTAITFDVCVITAVSAVRTILVLALGI